MGKQVRVPLGGPGTVDPLTAGLSNSWGRDLGRSSWALPSARSGRQEPRGNFLTYCRAWERYRAKTKERLKRASELEKGGEARQRQRMQSAGSIHQYSHQVGETIPFLINCACCLFYGQLVEAISWLICSILVLLKQSKHPEPLLDHA